MANAGHRRTGRQELAVVTGASSGIGQATARELAARGYHVLAGVRRLQDAETLRENSIEPVMLDITDKAAVATLGERVRSDREGRGLGALVNNAGVAVNAPVEVYGLADWRRLFEVNLFGHVAVTQTLLPALIESRGTVVNVSSVGGRMAMATYGPYAATKFALEAMSDALRREVGALGVKVVVIEPGAVTTGMLEQVNARAVEIVDSMTEAERGRYEALLKAVAAQAEASTKGGVSPGEVARVIVKAVASSRPRTRYTVGRGVGTIVRLTQFLSDRALDRLLAASLRPYLPGGSPAR